MTCYLSSVGWLRMKQYMSDTDYLPDAILHCPKGLIRDVTEMLPLRPLNAALNIMMHSIEGIGKGGGID